MQPGRSIAFGIDPKISRLGVLSKLAGFRIRSVALGHFGIAAIVVLVLTFIKPELFGSL